MPTSYILPNVVIAGFTKCGTSSLFEWLNEHPDVTGSTPKEAQYFMDEDSSRFHKTANYLLHGLDNYSAYFEKNYKPEAKIVLEATPGYVYQQSALKAFSTEPGLANTKLLFIVRDPAEKLYSTYKYFANNKSEIDNAASLGEFIELVKRRDPSLAGNEFLRDAIKHAEYVEYLEKWAQACGRQRIHVLQYQELKTNPKEFTKAVARLIGIDPSFYDTFNFKAENITYKVKNVWLHKLVIKARKYIPTGGIRNILKKWYRSKNVKASASSFENADPSTKEVLLQLRAHYAPFEARLKKFIEAQP